MSKEGRDKPLEVDGKGRPSLADLPRVQKVPGPTGGARRGEARDNEKGYGYRLGSLPACLPAWPAMRKVQCRFTL